MINLRINRAKTQLPLKIAKGTAQERINKAKKYTADFFENLTKETGLEDVTYAKFSTILKKTAGGKIGTKVEPNELYYKLSDRVANCYNQNGEQIGYCLFLRPKIIDGYKIGNKIKKIYVRNYIHQVYNFFYAIFNPKLNQRTNKIINSYETSSLADLCNENIFGKKPLEKSLLQQMLKGRKNNEKIDILQYLRYRIISEKNAYSQGNVYMQKLAELYAKSPMGDLLFTPKEKIREILRLNESQKIIEEELIKTLGQERKNIQKGNKKINSVI